VGRAVNTADYVSVGAQFGVNPAQALQSAAGASRAAGRAVGADQFGHMLGVERITGIDTAQQGAFMRGSRRTGGSGDATKVIEEAMVRGLQGSELGEELQKQTAYLEQQANKGIKLDQGAFLSMNQALTGVGIDPFRAGDLARGFAGGGQRIGDSGPSSGVDVRLMRAMGYTGTGGAEEYAGARLAMEKPENVMAALPGLLKDIGSAGGGGMGSNMKTLTARSILRSVGMDVSADEASKLMSGELSMEEFKGGQLSGAGATGRDLTSGTLKGEAGIEAERIATGARVATTMQNLARTTNNMAEAAASFAPILDRMTASMEEATGKIAMAAERISDSLGLAAGESLQP
jgi:hypothetical protein